MGKGKEAFQKAASNPTVQRIGKGVMGALQVVGGVVQTAGGAVISSTGLGAVLGVPVATHGVADVIQGSIKVFNAISGKNIKEINPIEEAYKWAGRSIGGKKGERIASKIFGVTDLALAFVTPGKAVANINKIKEFANAADKMKYLKTMISQSSTVNKIKNLPQFIKNVPRLAKGYAKEIPDIFKRAGSDLAAAPKKMYNAVKGMPTKISDKINDLKKLSSYCKNAVKTEIGAIKTAFGSGYKTYKQTQVSLGITSRSSLIEGLKEGIDKYKDAKNALSASSKGKLAGVVEGGTGNDVYAGVKEASEFLKSQNVPREYRKQILESFDVRTIKMETAGDSTFGIRFYGGEAQEKGRYLFETFSPTTNRNNLALPNQWNTMSGSQQFKVESGTQMITGNAAPQLQYGSQYVGGAKQWYINSLEVLSK
ncbi:hypothetical protein SDC9_112084 [bioreactor metagenome]|uniref:Uncharacterized protein n=1 Tax=bioreactor metagenome TaxID=1076179 RepID=A0A645BIU1_9ZZZZ